MNKDELVGCGELAPLAAVSVNRTSGIHVALLSVWRGIKHLAIHGRRCQRHRFDALLSPSV